MFQYRASSYAKNLNRIVMLLNKYVCIISKSNGAFTGPVLNDLQIWRFPDIYFDSLKTERALDYFI